jgi:hypothetical protein
MIMLGALSGCRSEVPSVAGHVDVHPQQYAHLIHALDDALTPLGLTKQSAPGLNELTKREVLFLSYAPSNSGRRPLVISDIKQPGVVEFQIYRQDFDSSAEYAQFVAAVIGTLRNFGTVVIENGVSSGRG